jgi:uncharacterized protein (DUF1499 family)
MLLALIFFLVALPVVAVLVQVDDFGRDFTTNWAETSWAASDTLLRPVSVARTVGEAAEMVKDAARSLTRWEFLTEETSGAAVVIRYVRTSALFRFKDDITVRVEDDGSRRLVTVQSQSRIGRGDLGQNPRNIKELLAAVRRLLDSPSS